MHLHLILTSILFCAVTFTNAEYLFEKDVPKFFDKPLPRLDDTSDNMESKPTKSLEMHDPLPTEPDTKIIKIRMQDAVSPRHDGHVCSGMKLDGRDAFINKKEAWRYKIIALNLASVYDQITSKKWKTKYPKDIRECEHSEYCRGPSTLIYVWALEGKARTLPKGVGYHIGGNTRITALVIGMHYKYKMTGGETDRSGYNLYVTHQRLPHQMGFYLLGGTGFVPAMANEFHMDMECRYNGDEVLHPIMYRTHSHNLGYITTAYRIRHNKWSLLGKMSPQLPQSFYDIAHPGMLIRPGDILAGRCTMKSRRHYVTYMGSTNKDEMCNFYIMYYKRTVDEPNHMTTCFEHRRDFHLEEEYFDDVPRDMSKPNGITGYEKPFMNTDPYEFDSE